MLACMSSPWLRCAWPAPCLCSMPVLHALLHALLHACAPCLCSMPCSMPCSRCYTTSPGRSVRWSTAPYLPKKKRGWPRRTTAGCKPPVSSSCGRISWHSFARIAAHRTCFPRRRFSSACVAFMNAKRPKYDQLIRLETGLLKHHCTFPQCPSYLVNLATAADRMTELDKKQHHTNGTRHGLFRHLKWFSVPDNKYRGSCHLTAWSVFKSRGNTPDACNELQRKLASKPPDYVEALLSSFERMGRHPVDQLRVASSSSAHSSGQPLEDDLVEADSKTGASSTSSHASAAASSSSSSSRRAGVYMAVADETDLLPPNLARQGSDEFKRIMLGAGKPAPARAAVTSVTLARQAQPGPRRVRKKFAAKPAINRDR